MSQEYRNLKLGKKYYRYGRKHERAKHKYAGKPLWLSADTETGEVVGDDEGHSPVDEK